MEINELKEKIQKLINYSDGLSERSKNLNKLLYQQLYEVIEVERLEKLEGKYLEAYLLWKSIMRANYQPKLTKLTPQDKDKLLMLIEAEIKLIEIRNQRQISGELTDEELLKELGLRIKSKSIKSNWERSDYGEDGATCLYIEDKAGKEILNLDLSSGSIKINEENSDNNINGKENGN